MAAALLLVFFNSSHIGERRPAVFSNILHILHRKKGELFFLLKDGVVTRNKVLTPSSQLVCIVQLAGN